MNEPLLRFLAMAKKELGASDARAEIGGLEPIDEDRLFYEAEGHFRIVLMFAEPPTDRAARSERLAQLVQGFLESSAPRSFRPVRPTPDDSAVSRLQEALEQLVERAGARVAAVVDKTSPELWGASMADDQPKEVVALVHLSETIADDPASDAALIGRAISVIRSEQDHEDGLFIQDGEGFVLRWFAGIYCLVVAFDRVASELKVESNVIRALPYIEKLVLSLPPLEPEPKGNKVVRMPFRVV